MDIITVGQHGINGANLTPRHLAELRASGLSDATIAACGFFSLLTPDAIASKLKWSKPAVGLGDALAIPFVGADGKPTGYCRLKPDSPRKSKGKTVKYESPRGASNRAYFPPGTRAAIADATIPLIVTEGEKKSAAADQAGYPCIGLVGVYGWQRKRQRDANGNAVGERQLIDDLAGIPWQGRPVFVVFDSDAATNPNVQRAELALAEALRRHGADVRIVRLPADGDAKCGLDDYLVKCGPDAFRKLLDAATPPAKPLTVIEAADDPHRLARLYLCESCTHHDGVTLRYWRDEWHQWDGASWRTKTGAELGAELADSAKREMDRVNLAAQQFAEPNKPPPTARKVTGRLVADVAHALQSMTILPARIDAPAWHGDDGPYPANEILACNNGLIHLPSLVTGNPHFMPPTPRFFATSALDYDFQLDAPAPSAWLDLLRRLWGEDTAAIATLQEWFGYLLTPDTRQQKILMLVGPKRSGKGTIARILRALVGADNCVGPTLSSLGTHFGMWSLVGKSAAIVADARLSGRTDAAAVAERLLSISGEDAQTIDRKNLPPITCTLPTRFLLMTNELPRLADASGALAGRMIVLRLTESWYGREDHGLTDRLLSELPSILLWSIEGWRRLRERGHFVAPESGKELAAELEDLASPVGTFVRERCRVHPAAEIERAALYAAWKSWCEQAGRDRPGSAATFGRDLRAVVPELRDVSRRDNEGTLRRCYVGIATK